MTFHERLEAILQNLQTASSDADKFDKGNDAAGRRLRSAAMDAVKELTQLRKDVQATRNSRKS